MSKILVSACLLGHKVRYDGNDCLQNNVRLQALIKSGKVITICPEMSGGLPTPRPPAEIQNAMNGMDALKNEARILTIDGADVTSQFIEGAYKALALVRQHNIQVAILKARSPSCGSKKIYDGTFSSSLIDGMGVTAALLSEHGVNVFDEYHIDEALEMISVK